MLQPPICASGKRSLAPGLARNYKPQHDLRLHAGITEGGIRGKMSALQSSIGNQALLRMMNNPAPVPQTQLAMNRPGDVFEQEANRVADHVMSATTSLMVQHRDLSAGGTVRRKCAECAEEEKLKRKPAGSRPVSAVPPIVHDVLRSPGRPLEGSTRNYMESRFQTDFSGVRIHTDDHASRSARAVNAWPIPSAETSSLGGTVSAGVQRRHETAGTRTGSCCATIDGHPCSGFAETTCHPAGGGWRLRGAYGARSQSSLGAYSFGSCCEPGPSMFPSAAIGSWFTLQPRIYRCPAPTVRGN